MENKHIADSERKYLQEHPETLDRPSFDTNMASQSDLQPHGELRRMIRVAMLNEMRI
ncbi:MAG: hypothetical protein HYV90_05630 [Candidatus Woesebacteria bacterium]|nr:MAG: hypothetical protein HYV90_05630 [Candidatus Woesebacteria bacterium]